VYSAGGGAAAAVGPPPARHEVARGAAAEHARDATRLKVPQHHVARVAAGCVGAQRVRAGAGGAEHAGGNALASSVPRRLNATQRATPWSRCSSIVSGTRAIEAESAAGA
jgi:hypothetical protein